MATLATLATMASDVPAALPPPGAPADDKENRGGCPTFGGGPRRAASSPPPSARECSAPPPSPRSPLRSPEPLAAPPPTAATASGPGCGFSSPSPSASPSPSCGFTVLSVAEAMNPSRRATMEDVTVVRPPGQWGCPDPHVAYLAVYDGHGGRDTVDFLKHGLEHHVAVEWEDASVDEAVRLERAFLVADVHARQSGILSSGATVALCLVKKVPNGVELVTANAGDARVVLATRHATFCRHSEPTTDGDELEVPATTPQPKPASSDLVAHRLTQDHNARNIREVRRVEALGGFIVRNRVVGVLAITRSLGDQVLKPYVAATPHVCCATVVADSATASPHPHSPNEVPDFVIVACDGLWDVFEDQGAVDWVVSYLARPGRSSLPGAANSLVREALRRGTADNVSVIVAFLDVT